MIGDLLKLAITTNNEALTIVRALLLKSLLFLI